MAYHATYPQRVSGSLLGGALGDALGYTVERDSLEAIRTRFGPGGVTAPPEDGSPFVFSDDTQLTLYTVDGLVEALEWANDGVSADEMAILWLAYLRWLATQGETPPDPAPVPPPRWIDAQEVLHHRRDPGNACLTGLLTGVMGTRKRPLNPQAKGSGALMRSAPFGLVPRIPGEMADRLTLDAAALTHGHPAAQTPAAVFSHLIRALALDELDLEAAVRSAVAHAGFLGDTELAGSLTAAAALAADGPVPPERLPDELGRGWLAPEALSLAVYAALASARPDPAEHFTAGVVLAVNHDGDSDTTGSVTGNILGALYGEAALPRPWLDRLDGTEVIRAVGSSLIKAATGE
ncbi:ADP-ribosylglycohydrolase family protein [Arthrobacter frigidicola]|nr:ADP-ribosylglycohydrolase family protein [Arthrobacter frigidicola]